MLKFVTLIIFLKKTKKNSNRKSTMTSEISDR